MKFFLRLVPNKGVRIFFSFLLILFVVGVCFYDYLSKSGDDTSTSNTSINESAAFEKLQENPLVSQLMERMSDITGQEDVRPDQVVSLKAGQTEKEVLDLLGEPSGRMTTTNRKILIYGGKQLTFVDGKLTEDAHNLPKKW